MFLSLFLSNIIHLTYYVFLQFLQKPEYLECRQLFLRFSETTDEEKIKELDSNIKSVETMKDGTRYLSFFVFFFFLILLNINILLIVWFR